MIFRLFCLPCPIQNKVYPLVLLAISLALSGFSGCLDMIFGYLLALAINKSVYLRDKIEPSDNKIALIESYLIKWDGKIGSKQLNFSVLYI